MDLRSVSFSGKTGIITGGAQGIGKAIARQFVDMGGKAVIVDINPETAARTCEELGNAVYYTVDLGDPDEVVRVFRQIVDEQGNVEVLINNAGIVNTDDFDQLTLDDWNRVLAVDLNDTVFEDGNIRFLRADLCSYDDICGVFEYAKRSFGGVHVLVNNGAISKFSKSIFEITPEEFRRVIDTNLCGSFMCCKQFVEANRGMEYGRIINIASTRWHQNEADWEAYGASKGGLVSLTNTLCVSLAGTRITVNAVSPGWIECSDYGSLTREDHMQHPSGRVGVPEDIARMVLFLAARENDFINGENITVDGGMTKKMIYIE